MSAPTAAEIAEARYWLGSDGTPHIRTLLAALDAAEARAKAAERERDAALRGFGLLPDDPQEIRRYCEVFAREIRECPPYTQGGPGVCACVSTITAHVRRMIVERLGALRERDEARAKLDGSIVVADTPETVERVRRAIIGDLRLPRLEDDHAARAVLAALREAGR